MSQLKSLTDWSGIEVNGIILGTPSVQDEWFVWDHQSIPEGIIDENGEIILSNNELDAQV